MEEVGHEAGSGRRLFVHDAAGTDEITTEAPVPGMDFVCLLAWDARQASAAEVGKVAARLLAAGCVYAVCWGPDCKRVHDLFDEEDVALRPDGPWAMTTWHPDQPLAEATWFALFSTWPDEAFVESCRAVLGVSVGSPGWAAELKAAFQAPSDFKARVLDGE